MSLPPSGVNQMAVDLRGRTKPRVWRWSEGTWVALVTRGYAGNYEHESTVWFTWEAAHRWAYNQVKNWRP